MAARISRKTVMRCRIVGSFLISHCKVFTHYKGKTVIVVAGHTDFLDQ